MSDVILRNCASILLLVCGGDGHVNPRQTPIGHHNDEVAHLINCILEDEVIRCLADKAVPGSVASGHDVIKITKTAKCRLGEDDDVFAIVGPVFAYWLKQRATGAQYIERSTPCGSIFKVLRWQDVNWIISSRLPKIEGQERGFFAHSKALACVTPEIIQKPDGEMVLRHGLASAGGSVVEVVYDVARFFGSKKDAA